MLFTHLRTIDLLPLFLLGVALVYSFVVTRRLRMSRFALREQRITEDTSRMSQWPFSVAFAASPYPSFIVDVEKGIVLETNDEFERTLGYAKNVALGKTPQALGVWTLPEFDSALRRMLERDGRLRNVEVEFQTVNGTRRHALCSAEPLEFRGTQAVLVALNDITERKELEAKLSHQAFHDALTGIPNKALLYDRLKQALSGASRSGRVPAVMLFDVDNFKQINETFGHAIGDELLRSIAQRILPCLRQSDTCARFGGDEFALLLDNVGTPEEATQVATRVVSALQAPFILQETEVFVGISMGVALSNFATSADEQLRNADIALYASKHQGKGQVTVFEPSMHSAVLQRVELENELRGAMERQELTVHYQPISSIPGGTVVGFEALLRWNHPSRGVLAPKEFMAIAEETGLIIDIGKWVLKQACQEARRLQERVAEGSDRLSMTVNFTARQLTDPQLVREVFGALHVAGVPPETLVIEIPERVLIQNDGDMMQRVWELKKLGVKVAIGDFGTGSSSLAYLLRLPVDVLKVDKSFTARIGGGGSESPLSRAVLALGNTLRIQTVAEGVETDAQWRRLAELGCDLGQGYLIGKPLPADRMDAFLAGSVGNGAAHK